MQLKKIKTLLTNAEQKKALWIIALIILMAIAEMLSVLSIAPFLSALSNPEALLNSPALATIFQQIGITNKNDAIYAIGLATIATVILSSLFKASTLHIVGRFVHFLRQSIGTRLLENYLKQPYEFFLHHAPPELAKNILSEVEQIIFDLLQPLANLIAHGTVAIAITILIFSYDPKIALCTVAGISLMYTFIYKVARNRLSEIGAARRQADSTRYKKCVEVLHGIKDVKINNAAQSYLDEFSKSSRTYSRHFATAETLSQAPLYIVEAAGYSGLILIALFLIWKNQDASTIFPALGLYGFSAYRLLPAAQIMYRGFARLQFSSAALEHIYQDLKLESDSILTNKPPIIIKNKIRLENISYAYPSNPLNKIIDSLSITITANSSLAIIGRSGSGKSTLMDLMLGLLVPQHGRIYIDDTPLSNENIANWQQTIGYVPQHVHIADDTIIGNIAFGYEPDLIDMSAVEAAAKAAHIHEFVSTECQLGYQTVIGDNGIRLSGGQRQRIGIARALYRNPQILFMDEATSSLDQSTEKSINETIRQLSSTKTIILITHRALPPSLFDQIITLPAQN